MKIMVMGGVGFIGANFLNLLVTRFHELQFVNVDKLTYAVNLGSIRAIEESSSYKLHRVDITNFDAVDAVLEESEIGIAWDAEDIGIEGPSKILASTTRTDPILDYVTDPQTGFLPYPSSEYPVGASTS